MLRSLDKTLTKVAQDNIDKFTQSLSQEEPKTPPSKISSSRLLPQSCPKQAALFIRNAVRNVIRKHFRRMLSRMLIKRACWRLLKSKSKRDMEKAFLLIRNYSNQQALESMHKFYNRMPELRIMVSLCSRILAKPERKAVERIRTHSLRKKRVHQFIRRLEECLTAGIFREAARTFWSVLLMEKSRQRQRQLGSETVFRWIKTRISIKQRGCLFDLFDFVLMNSCSREVQEWRSKKDKIAQNSQTRKQALAKVRQDLKTAKSEYDQQKGARNKLQQQYKKSSHSTKTEMTDLLRQHEKEKKVEEAQCNQIKSELEDIQRILATRSSIGQKNPESEELCFKVYRLIAAEEEQFKGLQKIIPTFGEDLTEFKQSRNYFFLKNLEMEKLIDVYEKRQPYNYEAKYYDMEYENRVVRETMRCFVREKFEADVSRHRWKHHHTKRDSPEEEERNSFDVDC